MKMKKPLVIMIALLLAILIGGGVTYFLMNNSEKDDSVDIESILERSIETEQITTSLKDGAFAQVSFKIQTDSVETKEELEKRMYQVKNIIINHFASNTTTDIKKEQSIATLENTLTSKINDVLENGEVEKIYTTSYVLQ